MDGYYGGYNEHIPIHSLLVGRATGRRIDLEAAKVKVTLCRCETEEECRNLFFCASSLKSSSLSISCTKMNIYSFQDDEEEKIDPQKNLPFLSFFRSAC